MAPTPLPPVEFLRECFSYDPDTGKFTWKKRPYHHFDKDHLCDTWNARLAGKPAFQTKRKGGYLCCEVVYEGRRVRLGASRVALKLTTGEEPEMVDHINRIVTDNRAKNLRAADHDTNQANTIGRVDKVLPKGVHMANKFRGKFTARAYDGGKKLHLGTFTSPAEAHAVYCAYGRARYGEHFNPGPHKPSIFD